LSRINEAIVRIREPEKLYQEACRIAVVEGSFRMAWIGTVDPATSRVAPVAHFGYEEGYLSRIEVSSDPGVPEGRGPAGVALSTSSTFISNDIETDPAFAPWRDEALRLGYRSCAACSLQLAKDKSGVFLLYAGEPHYFNEEEIHLLTSLSEDISFALQFMKHEENKKLAELALLASEEKFRMAFRISPDSINLTRVSDGMVIDINEGFTSTMGYTRGEAIGKTSLELDLWADPRDREQLVAALKKDGFVENMEADFRGKDGKIRTGLMSARL
jgi:PAS domain S-box-containing protein